MCRWLVARGADPAALTYDGDGAFNPPCGRDTERRRSGSRRPTGGTSRGPTGGDVTPCRGRAFSTIRAEGAGGGAPACVGRTRRPGSRPRALADGAMVNRRPRRVPGGAGNAPTATPRCTSAPSTDTETSSRIFSGRGGKRGRIEDGTGRSRRGALGSRRAKWTRSTLAKELRELEDRTLRLPVVFREGGG